MSLCPGSHTAGIEQAIIDAVCPEEIPSQLFVLKGLPPGEFPVSIFDLVLNGQTVRGSIVGTRKDLEEALQFAARRQSKATIEQQPMASINDIFDRLKNGKVNGRIVLDIAGESGAKKSTGSKTSKTLAAA
jgi:propanol-preferring alcohol dehydrogenase